MARISFLAVLLLFSVSILFSCSPREATRQFASDAASLLELNTRVNQYVEQPSGDPFEAEFGGYDIDLVMQAVEAGNLEGIDSFRITIDTRYGDKVAKREEALSIPALKIDSLSIRLILNDSVVWPTIFADNFAERKDEPEMRRKRLLGPSYRYDLVRIPAIYGSLDLSFVAMLVDRKTNAVVERARVERTLEAVSELKYYPPSKF